MELDDFKTRWAEQDRRIDESLRISRQLLSETRLSQSQMALRRAGWLTAAHAALWLICLLALGSFGYDHRGEARFLAPAIVVGVYAIGMLHTLIRQMALGARVDYGEAVAEIQRRLEELRILRIRTTQWAVLVGLTVWVPALIVVVRGVWDVDLYRSVSTAWIAANIAFGLGCIPAVVWMARRYGSQWGAMQQIARDLAGKNLNAAVAFLGTLREWE